MIAKTTIKKWLNSGKITFLILNLAIVACSSYRSNLEERQETAKVANDKHQDIVIAVVETKDSWFKEGVDLAIKKLNAGGGILKGREFKPIYYNDKGDIRTGQKIARKIAQNLDIVAVIGHRHSSVAVPVSITYEKNGIVFISTGSTIPTLTAHDGQYTFRNIPSDKTIGQGLAKFAARQNFKKVFVIFERESYGKQLAEFFRETAGETRERPKMEVVAMTSYNKKQNDFRPLLVEAKEENLDFDVIFVAGGASNAMKLIRQTRSLGITQPFIGGDSLDSSDLWDELGYNAIGTFVASVFNPKQNKQSKQFVKEFRKEYNGKEPDKKAALGYDAVKVLARAIENSKSTIPIEMAMALKYMTGWKGTVGSYHFLSNGDVESATGIYVKRLSAGGRFKFIH